MDIAVGIAYGEDVGKARAALLQLAATTPKVLQGENMPTEVVAVNLGDSAVNLELRVWAASSDYWDVKFTLTQGVYETLGKNGIEIPFNQMTVHIDKE